MMKPFFFLVSSSWLLLCVVLLSLPDSILSMATTKRSSNSNERKPWEFGRFVQQSSKFVQFPPFMNPSSSSPSSGTKIQPGDVLWSSSSSSPSSMSFGPLDDVVMGGASRSTFDASNGVWKGTVTDANNGGFIGIRSFPPQRWDMTACQGMEWTFRSGQGKRFKIVTRDSTDFNGICWSTSIDVGTNPIMKLFDTNNKDSMTTKVRIPFEKQIPTLFAKTVPNTKEFQKDNVVGVQLAYSKFEYDGGLNPKFEVGDVKLEIVEIKAY